ncbi:MAG: AbrB/MazE/SpoVT family DNA-binding domain-containing protein [Austwickia sp.]|nr:AbrB/MazE/SpoVT family DNA-binding domain-containing protein [Austwickia sp.]MCO5309198.1 AbrB/MazE/SpoVT family DNA-binding domain-containing protein [Austwickia sp.]
MRTTIDGAGRVVVPKALRDAMGLSAGRELDIVYVDGRIEISLPPADVHVDTSGALPVIRPTAPLPPLSDDVVATTIDRVRR